MINLYGLWQPVAIAITTLYIVLAYCNYSLLKHENADEVNCEADFHFQTFLIILNFVPFLL